MMTRNSMADFTIDKSLILKTFTSTFNNNLTVIVLNPEADNYHDISHVFNQAGHAFFVPGKNLIIVDGGVIFEPWFTMSHLDVIQGHEIGHFLAGHGTKDHSDLANEREADWLGLNIIKQKGSTSAQELYYTLYEERYNCTPEADNDIMTHLIHLI